MITITEKLKQLNELKQEIDSYFEQFLDCIIKYNKKLDYVEIYRIEQFQSDFEIHFTYCFDDGNTILEGFDYVKIPIKYINDFSLFEADKKKEYDEKIKKIENAKRVQQAKQNEIDMKEYERLKKKFEANYCD